MARFHGKIGYGNPAELVNGVWSDSITERPFTGDIPNETRNLIPTNQVNDDIRMSHRISIVADAFALSNYTQIKYAEYGGVYWTVTSVSVERPRLILTLGGVWNGNNVPTP